MKSKTIMALFIAAVLIASICAVALVACNDQDASRSKSSKGEKGESGVISDKEINALIGFVATEGSKEGEYAGFNVLYRDVEDVMGSDRVEEYGKYILMVAVSDFDESSYAYLYRLDSAQHANYYAEHYEGEGESISEVRGTDVIVGNAEFFYDVVMKSSIPSSLSKARANFMRNCMREMDEHLDTATSFNISSNSDEGIYDVFDFTVYSDPNTNCQQFYRCLKIAPEERHCLYEEHNFAYGTSDSYIDFDTEDGYAFVKYVDKPGFHYEDYAYIDYYGDGSSEVEGLSAVYFYDKNSPKDIVVPSEANGKKVICFSESEYGGDGATFKLAKSITLSEGILVLDTVFNRCENLVSITIPASIKRLPGRCPFQNCPKFTTVNYAGTMDEWKALFRGWDGAWNSYYDYSLGQTVEASPFTVKCSNGSITYPIEY